MHHEAERNSIIICQLISRHYETHKNIELSTIKTNGLRMNDMK